MYPYGQFMLMHDRNHHNIVIVHQLKLKKRVSVQQWNENSEERENH